MATFIALKNDGIATDYYNCTENRRAKRLALGMTGNYDTVTVDEAAKLIKKCESTNESYKLAGIFKQVSQDAKLYEYLLDFGCTFNNAIMDPSVRSCGATNSILDSIFAYTPDINEDYFKIALIALKDNYSLFGKGTEYNGAREWIDLQYENDKVELLRLVDTEDKETKSQLEKRIRKIGQLYKTGTCPSIMFTGGKQLRYIASNVFYNQLVHRQLPKLGYCNLNIGSLFYEFRTINSLNTCEEFFEFCKDNNFNMLDKQSRHKFYMKATISIRQGDLKVLSEQLHYSLLDLNREVCKRIKEIYPAFKILVFQDDMEFAVPKEMATGELLQSLKDLILDIENGRDIIKLLQFNTENSSSILNTLNNSKYLLTL